jgi:hypothetical protein
VTRKSGPKQEDAWQELCRRSKRVAAVDLHTVPLAEAIDAVLNQIELGPNANKQKSLVRLASVLIRLEAAQLSSPENTNSQQPLVQLEQARRCAEALALHQELRGPAIPRPKPTIAEPEEPLSLTVFDLVRVVQNVLEATKAAKSQWMMNLTRSQLGFSNSRKMRHCSARPFPRSTHRCSTDSLRMPGRPARTGRCESSVIIDLGLRSLTDEPRFRPQFLNDQRILDQAGWLAEHWTKESGVLYSQPQIDDLYFLQPDEPPCASLWTLSRKCQWLAFAARRRRRARESKLSAQS